MEGESEEGKITGQKARLLRCMDWLQKQNSLEPKKQSLQNKNDIQFIIRSNADRKNFLLSVAEDEATVPVGVDEPVVEPQPVPIHRLRVENLRLECEWQSCNYCSNDYEAFQKHIESHTVDIHVIDKEDNVDLVCLWDVCGYKTSVFKEMVRHINYHAYHARLLAIGFNGRATLKLLRCKKDSSKRNHLPPLLTEHACLWVGCEDTFDSIQKFFNHVKVHIYYSQKDKQHLCSWAGCGMTFPRRVLLTMHVRSHTGERLIACYHCGQHFACNRKLCDHLRRQNVYPNSGYTCTVCGVACATEYLLREHARQHICAYACALCDMSAPSPAALAHHVRYRHLDGARVHACPHCSYKSDNEYYANNKRCGKQIAKRLSVADDFESENEEEPGSINTSVTAVTKWDLKKHIPTHFRKKRKMKKSIKSETSDKDLSDEESSEEEVKTKKPPRKYACHMCPEENMKVFTRGTSLTTHLVKVHGAQWPFGHSRFRYQISKDGMYRLTTTRFEFLDVSKKIVDGYSGPKESLNTSFEFDLKQVDDATPTTPKRFEITLKDGEYVNEATTAFKVEKIEPCAEENTVEITMCDIDEYGNIISSEIIKSDVVFS